MPFNGPKTVEMFRKAQEVMPAGVTSNFRYWDEDETPVIARGKGPYIWDMDGNRYIDYRLAFGPVILGHAHPEVNKAVAEAIQNGVLFAATHPLEIELAEKIIQITGVEMVRYANSGSEATMHALRIARGYTGREKIIKFEGQYHGMYDYMLYSTAGSKLEKIGPRENPTPYPQSLGMPKCTEDLLILLPFNDKELLDKALKEHGEEVAAIIVEPLLGNVASIMPEPGWLEFLRQKCDEYGIVLIFDEVKTGFRIAPGGAQEYFGVKADLVTYAKSMGNGFPVAAIGGKKEIMTHVRYGEIAHGGTYTGNMVATSAALATLKILETGEPYRRLEETGKALMAGIDQILTDEGIPHVITGVPSMFGIVYTDKGAPKDLREYLVTNTDTYESIAMKLIEKGVMPDPDGREPWFLTSALSQEDVAFTLARFEEAVKEFKQSK